MFYNKDVVKCKDVKKEKKNRWRTSKSMEDIIPNDLNKKLFINAGLCFIIC